MRKRTFITLIFLMLLFPVTPGLAANWNWSAGVVSDYETTLTHLMWHPDPNAGIGALAITDSDVAGTHIMLGPVGRINTGEIYAAALSQILPQKYLDVLGNIAAEIPVQPFAQASILWDFDGHGVVGVAGTGFILFPDSRIKPTIFTAYFRPSGDSSMSEQWRTTFGVTISF